jgi:hypothetical protein
MDVIPVVAIAALMAHLAWSAYTQRALLKLIEADRKSLDTARLEIVGMKSPQVAQIVMAADQARTAAGVAEFMQRSVHQLADDPDEELYG